MAGLSWNNVGASFSDANNLMLGGTRTIAAGGDTIGNVGQSLLAEQMREEERQLALEKWAHTKEQDAIKNEQWEKTYKRLTEDADRTAKREDARLALDDEKWRTSQKEKDEISNNVNDILKQAMFTTDANGNTRVVTNPEEIKANALAISLQSGKRIGTFGKDLLENLDSRSRELADRAVATQSAYRTEAMKMMTEQLKALHAMQADPNVRVDAEIPMQIAQAYQKILTMPASEQPNAMMLLSASLGQKPNTLFGQDSWWNQDSKVTFNPLTTWGK